MPSKMTEDRIQLLDSVKFVWRAPRGPRRRRGKPSLQVPRPNNGSRAEATAFASEMANLTGINGHRTLGSMSSLLATNQFREGSCEIAFLGGSESHAYSGLGLGTGLTSCKFLKTAHGGLT